MHIATREPELTFFCCCPAQRLEDLNWRSKCKKNTNTVAQHNQETSLLFEPHNKWIRGGKGEKEKKEQV